MVTSILKSKLFNLFILTWHSNKKPDSTVMYADSRFKFPQGETADWQVWEGPYLSPYRHFIIKLLGYCIIGPMESAAFFFWKTEWGKKRLCKCWTDCGSGHLCLLTCAKWSCYVTWIKLSEKWDTIVLSFYKSSDTVLITFFCLFWCGNELPRVL